MLIILTIKKRCDPIHILEFLHYFSTLESLSRGTDLGN